jgi:hypothetical protein
MLKRGVSRNLRTHVAWFTLLCFFGFDMSELVEEPWAKHAILAQGSSGFFSLIVIHEVRTIHL